MSKKSSDFWGFTQIELVGDAQIYYGAADTRVCLTTTQLDDLFSMCEPV